MKNKFKFLVRQSLGKKINTKWFKITNVIILVLMILLANMDRIISYFGGDFNDEVTVYVEDHLGLYDTFKETFDNWSKMLGNSKNIVINKNNENIEDFKNTLQDNNKILRERIMEKHVDALHRFGKIRKDICAIVISNTSRNKRVAKNCSYTKYR